MQIEYGPPDISDMEQYCALADIFAEHSGWRGILGEDMDNLGIINWAIENNEANPDKVFARVAKHGSTVVGFIVVARYVPPCAVNKVFAQELAWFVLPEYRKKPVGMSLYRAAKSWAEEMGSDALIMLTLRQSKVDLEPIYRRLGYINIESVYALPLKRR